MDSQAQERPALGGQASGLRCAQVPVQQADPLGGIAAGLGPGPFELVLLFVSNRADFAAVAAAAHERLPARHVAACTTGGEIGAAGYEDGQILALGLLPSHFRAACYLIEGLDRIDPQTEVDRLIRHRVALGDSAPQFTSEFAFLEIDGLSRREDELAAVLSVGLGGVPLFGGSAGDGEAFQRTLLSLDGDTGDNRAMVALVRTICPIRVFSLDHLSPTATKMVVTEADPLRRLVSQINAEPAAQEYARIVGKPPEALDHLTFAAHPVVVQLGQRHHVRAIQRVNEDGDLVFFSAIDEGMVLTLATSEDLAAHLDRELAALSRHRAPEMILGCDCVLRRVEAAQNQQTRAVSEVLRRHRVRGFSTYGEQLGALHVNHTMTGVAFYAPEDVE